MQYGLSVHVSVLIRLSTLYNVHVQSACVLNLQVGFNGQHYGHHGVTVNCLSGVCICGHCTLIVARLTTLYLNPLPLVCPRRGSALSEFRAPAAAEVRVGFGPAHKLAVGVLALVCTNTHTHMARHKSRDELDHHGASVSSGLDTIGFRTQHRAQQQVSVAAARRTNNITLYTCFGCSGCLCWVLTVVVLHLCVTPSTLQAAVHMHG